MGHHRSVKKEWSGNGTQYEGNEEDGDVDDVEDAGDAHFEGGQEPRADVDGLSRLLLW